MDSLLVTYLEIHLENSTAAVLVPSLEESTDSQMDSWMVAMLV